MASTATSIQIDQPACEIRLSVSGALYPKSVILTVQPRAGYRGLATGETFTWSIQNAPGTATGTTGIVTITGATGVDAIENGSAELITATGPGRCMIQVTDTASAYDDFRTIQVVP